jgi:hypothetical protein
MKRARRPESVVGSPPSEGLPPEDVAGAPPSGTREPKDLAGVAKDETRAPEDFVDPVKEEARAPESVALVPKGEARGLPGEAGARKDAAAAPTSHADFRARHEGVARAAFRAFIVRPDTRGMVLAIARQRVGRPP